jgi:polyferredoxin
MKLFYATDVHGSEICWKKFISGGKFYEVDTLILGGDHMPLITFAGLIFFLFLDWLLIEWFWDPGGYYGIGWSNTSSMVFMIILYALAAIIYFGFSAYRRRQGIDVNKVYQEIPVE